MKIDSEFVKNALIPILSLLVALLGVMSPHYLQLKNMETNMVLKKDDNEKEIRLKKYEVSFREKQKSYADLMQKIEEDYYKAGDIHESSRMEKCMERSNQIVFFYYSIEPFISLEKREITRNLLNKILMNHQEMCSVDNSSDLIPYILEADKMFSEFKRIILEDVFDKDNKL